MGRVQEDLIYAKVATDGSLGGRKLTARGNRVVNNIFVDSGKPIVFGTDGNTAAHNVYLSTRSIAPVAPGAEPGGVNPSGEARWDPAERRLTWNPGGALPLVPVVRNCPFDMAGIEREGETTLPGPLLSLAHAATVRID
jgi:hypothetical protein